MRCSSQLLQVVIPAIIFLLLQTSNAQQLHFFSDTLQNGCHGQAMHVQRLGKYIFVGGQSFDTLQTPNCPSIVKLDTAGNTIWTYTLNKQIDKIDPFTGKTMFEHGNILDLVIDSQSVFAHAYVSGQSYHELWKIDQITGDLVWKKIVPECKMMGVADANRIAFTYNSGDNYVYELVDKTTGRSVSTHILTTAVGGAGECNFTVDTDGSVYIARFDSLLKYDSPDLANLVWGKKTGIPGSIYKIQPANDGKVYIGGGGATPFAGRVDKSTGNLDWVHFASYLQGFLEDYLVDFKLSPGHVYISGDHINFGSIYSAFHIAKFDRNTGEAKFDIAYNPGWNPNPNTNAAPTGANSLVIDDNENVYASGYESGNDARFGVWSVCKFNSSGKLVYHASLFDGTSAGSSRGVYSFLYDNKIFHIGDLTKSDLANRNTVNDTYCNVFVVGTDTSSTFRPYSWKKTIANYQEFSDVKQVAPFSQTKYIVLKQVGTHAELELKDAYTENAIWTKIIRRPALSIADKMCVTADKKIYISLLQYGKEVLQYDYNTVASMVEFIKLDSSGLILRDTSYNIDNPGNFQSLQLLPTSDTNTIYIFKNYETSRGFIVSQAFNIERAVGSVSAPPSSLYSMYVPSAANQQLIVPLTKDTAAMVVNRFYPGSCPATALMDLLTFKNNTGAGYLNPGFGIINDNVQAHNLAACDSTSFILLGTNATGNDEILRYGSRSHSIMWKNTEAIPTKLDLAQVTGDNVFVAGRNGRNLLVRRLKKQDGSLIWDRQQAPPIPGNQYIIPVDAKFNPQKGYYIISGFIIDSTNILSQQLVFYSIYDTNGVQIKNFVQAGDYQHLNNLKTIGISPFGQTLIGGALYKYPYGRSGVLIEADTAQITFSAPTITLNSLPSDSACNGDSVLLVANVSGCQYCQYSWSAPLPATGDSAYVHSTGTYQFTAIQNGISYSASKSVYFYPAIPKPGLAINGSSLTASGGSVYKWFFNGHVKSGASGPTLQADSAGYYWVRIVSGICQGPISDSVQYVISGLIDPFLVAHVSIFPNPIVDKVCISNAANLKLSIIIYDNYGRMVKKTESSGSLILIDLQKESAGIYLVRILDKRTGKKGTWKIMKS